MTDFDKLIKEKAEQAEYSYKPAAWKSFRHKAGMGLGAVKYWVAGLSSALIVGGVTSFLVFRTHHNITEPSMNSQTVASDSTCELFTSAAQEDTLMVLEAPSAEQTVSRKGKTSPEVRVSSETVKSVEDKSVETSANQPICTPHYGRPLVIDVDTIKENVPTDEQLRNGNSRLF